MKRKIASLAIMLFAIFMLTAASAMTVSVNGTKDNLVNPYVGLASSASSSTVEVSANFTPGEREINKIAILVLQGVSVRRITQAPNGKLYYMGQEIDGVSGSDIGWLTSFLSQIQNKIVPILKATPNLRQLMSEESVTINSNLYQTRLRPVLGRLATYYIGDFDLESNRIEVLNNFAAAIQ